MPRLRAGAVGATLLVGAIQATAQDSSAPKKYTSMATYSVSVPIGDTRRYVSHPGWAGFGWEGQWLVRPSARAGVGFNVYDFTNVSSGTTQFPSGAATGEQSRDLMNLSVTGTGRWYVGGDAGRGPYLGLGAGAVWTQQSYQLGILPQLVRTAWHAMVAPEAGVAVPVYDNYQAIVSVRYVAPVANGHYLGGGSRSFQFVALNIGLGER